MVTVAVDGNVIVLGLVTDVVMVKVSSSSSTLSPIMVICWHTGLPKGVVGRMMRIWLDSDSKSLLSAGYKISMKFISISFMHTFQLTSSSWYSVENNLNILVNWSWRAIQWNTQIHSSCSSRIPLSNRQRSVCQLNCNTCAFNVIITNLTYFSIQESSVDIHKLSE